MYPILPEIAFIHIMTRNLALFIMLLLGLGIM